VELPRLQEIWNTYEDEELSIVAIQSDQDHEKGRRLVEEKGLSFYILRNEVEKDVVNEIYLSEGNPTTYIIDREGRVLSYHLGFQKGDEVEIEQEITALLTSTSGCL
jgi:cytochrome c biogenesis protein CcmG/thiol:disulfide interchange protein DsbE